MLPPSTYLQELIVRHGGAISLECFMQEALYHPRYGYYAKRVRRLGRGGDFSTSVTLHDALPRALAAWAWAHRAEVLHRGEWHVIELGGGEGQMAEGFLRALGWFGRHRVRYHLLEVSEPLRTLQRQRLERFGDKMQWHSDMREAVAVAGGQCLVFSNEFVDAFPCLQLCRDGAGTSWNEVKVAWTPGSFQAEESLVPWVESAHDPVESSVLDPAYESSVRPGHRVEIHRSYKAWLEGWLPAWSAGRLLTIDYGDLLPAVYHRRPQGTLRAYAHHQLLTGAAIHQNFGQQDLTADVNFSDLQRWGECLGLHHVGFGIQAEFLGRWLPAKRLVTASLDDPALAYLLDEAGPGSAFKVLEQGKRPAAI